MFNTSVIKRRAGVRFNWELDFGAVRDGRVIVRQNLGLFGGLVVVLVKDVLDVVVYREATGALGVFTLEVYAVIICAHPVFGDFVLFLKDVTEVEGVTLSNLLYAKVVNNERKEYCAPLFAP